MLKLKGYSAHGSRLETYDGYSPVKANGLMRAQGLSGNSAHGFREGKAVSRPQAVWRQRTNRQGPETRISVSARPNHWHLTNRFSLYTRYFAFILGTGYNRLGNAVERGMRGTGAAQGRLLNRINPAST